MNKLVTDTITDFNDTSKSLALELAEVCPKSIIGTNIKDIIKAFNNPINMAKFIDLFCVKVLRYKAEIDSGNEDFFMNKSYDKELEPEIAPDYIDSIKTVFRELSPENKDLVKKYMQILCSLAQQYFDIVMGTHK